MRPELVVLIKARALIADPAKWGKGVRGSRDDHRRPLDTCCAAEAIEDVGGPREWRTAAYGAVRRAAGAADLVRWNDAPERTHAEVLAAFDKAIASAS